MTSALPEGTNMWIRSFYGFSPQEDGYVGWSQETGRDHLLKQIKDGDLILIYGAGAKETKKVLRSHVLGFVQVDARKIRDTDKSSKAGLESKAEKGWADKWTYGIPVRRAWRVDEKVMISQIAFETYRPEAGRAIAAWSAELQPEEIEKALKIRVTEVEVYGESPVGETALKNRVFAEEFSPSRAFPGTSGTRTATYNDGATFLYLAQFDGDGHALIGKPKPLGDKRVALKIGVSNDPVSRAKQLNAGIPPAAQGKWVIGFQAQFPDRKAAEAAEQNFKDRSAGSLESLGGEFFWGDQTDGMLLFAKLPGVSRF